jgi:hypothetical protein
VAKTNLESYRGARACNHIQVVLADAADYLFPAGDLIVFLFNPFTAQILKPVLDRLSMHEGHVIIVYHSPPDPAMIDAHPGFTPLAGVVLTDHRNLGRLWKSRSR